MKNALLSSKFSSLKEENVKIICLIKLSSQFSDLKGLIKLSTFQVLNVKS